MWLLLAHPRSRRVRLGKGRLTISGGTEDSWEPSSSKYGNNVKKTPVFTNPTPRFQTPSVVHAKHCSKLWNWSWRKPGPVLTPSTLPRTNSMGDARLCISSKTVRWDFPVLALIFLKSQSIFWVDDLTIFRNLYHELSLLLRAAESGEVNQEIGSWARRTAMAFY